MLNKTWDTINQSQITTDERTFVINTLNKYASLGYQDAVYQLGIFFSNGMHIEKDIEYANYLFRTNYENSHLQSGGFLALNLLHEHAANKENTELLSEAITLLESVQPLNEVTFQRELARAYFIIGEVAKGEAVLRWCVENGDLSSTLKLAEYLELKADIDQSALSEAKSLYEELLNKNYETDLVAKRLQKIKGLTEPE